MKKNTRRMDCMKAMEIFKILFFGGFCCAVAAMILSRICEPALYILGWMGIIGVVGGLAFGYSQIRCPCCGGMLLIGRMPGVPGSCPECGKKLRDD